MIMKQMKRASKKGKTLTINKIPSSDDFRMNFRRLIIIINRELFVKIFLHAVLLLLSRTEVSCGVISVDHQLDGRGCQFKISWLFCPSVRKGQGKKLFSPD